jgi:hypothetical protein
MVTPRFLETPLPQCGESKEKEKKNLLTSEEPKKSGLLDVKHESHGFRL